MFAIRSAPAPSLRTEQCNPQPFSTNALQLITASILTVMLLAFAEVVAAAPAVARPATTIFESGQVRPLALSPNGKLLFAVNTPDNRLEIFAVRPHGLRHRASVPVGLEPVAVHRH